MNGTEFIQLLAASLIVALAVSVVAYAVSSSMERAEEEDAELLRIQLGADPIKRAGECPDPERYSFEEGEYSSF